MPIRIMAIFLVPSIGCRLDSGCRYRCPMKKDSPNRKILGCLFLCSFNLFASLVKNTNLDSLVAEALEFSRQQMMRTVVELSDYGVYGDANYPRGTDRLTGRWQARSAGHWASGFLPGCLWRMYDWTQNVEWRNWADRWTSGLINQQYRTADHEAGFILPSSYGCAYRLTGQNLYAQVLLQGAASLATRYNSTVGCIRSWNSYHFPVIIDGLCALQLLWWAAKNGGQKSGYGMAVNHALKTIENNVRPDGSVFQIVDYNVDTGAVISRTNKQGYTSESTWARGQAWAIYGLSVAYRETGDIRFLQAAQKTAEYFIENLPGDHVPYWDFKAPNIPDEEKDVSAAAIAASGLLELSSLDIESLAQEKHRNAACSILASLCSPAYLAKGTNSRGILLHGVGNRMNADRNAGEVDVSLIYADYYFIEALLRYRQTTASAVALNQERQHLSFHRIQNFPNPFNDQTVIDYELPQDTQVEIVVFSVNGKKVKTLINQCQQKGKHSIRWDGRDEAGLLLHSGMYLCQLKTDEQFATRRMVYIK